MQRTLRRLVVVAAALLLPTVASAQYTFTGRWSVADGPHWQTNPQVMSGVETAAFLFGGSPADYAISTRGSDISLINFKTFLDGWNDLTYLSDPAAQDFKSSSALDGGYNCGFTSCSHSAFVSDNSVPGQYVNYAFRIDGVTTTPEPATAALLASGLVAVAGMGVVRRRRGHS